MNGLNLQLDPTPTPDKDHVEELVLILSAPSLRPNNDSFKCPLHSNVPIPFSQHLSEYF